MTYQELQARNRMLNSSSIMTGLGALFALGGVGGIISKNPAMATLGIGAGLANIGLGIAAAKKAHDVSPVTVGDAGTIAARPIAELLTTVPGLAMTGEGVVELLNNAALKRGVVTPKAVASLGLTGLGAMATMGGKYLNKAIQDRIDEAAARRLGIAVK